MTTRPIAPPAVRWITRTLEEAGFETWAVGGAIRDARLGRPSDDWDLATRATPSQLRRLFRRTVPIGVEHGTVGVLARDRTLYEVTTFRKDVETDGRHAVVAFAETLEEDLARRDFTINAIAWHPLREVWADPFDGGVDLERRVLRTVGVPAERFAEDYLRILRALRFAGRFGLDIEAETWRSLSELVERLVGLSAERIREELLKVLGADPHPSRALDLYRSSGALGVLYGELADMAEAEGAEALGTAASAQWGRTLATVDALPTGRPYLRLAALLRPLSADASAALLLRLRLSNAQVDEVARLAASRPLPSSDADDETVRRWLSAHGAGRLTSVARLDLAEARATSGDDRSRPDGVVAAWRRARCVRRSAPPLAVGDLAIDGRGLITLGLKPGPHFGRILDDLLDWVLADPARNDPALLRERVRSMEGDA